ncbi:hypothetical protein AB0L40_20645, partial [Patulibacter sp. NPDC049589]|uniref:hypothetical protein n=1 Tax=Patulibacter sp. NPDC049589 TaxID=3154731 RepID=UPI003425A424
VERSNPNMQLIRLEHKLGIRASDTAQFELVDWTIPTGSARRWSGAAAASSSRRGRRPSPRSTGS